MARAKALPKGGGNGVVPEYPPATPALLAEYSTGSSGVDETENAASSAKTSSEVQGLPLGVLSNEYESEDSSQLGASFLKDTRSFPEFLACVHEECEEQGASELVDSGAAERWLNDWIGKGWKDRNGRSLDELLTDEDGASVERWRLIAAAFAERRNRICKGRRAHGTDWQETALRRGRCLRAVRLGGVPKGPWKPRVGGD